MTKVERMQRETGSAGILGSYRPAFSNVVYSNYPALLNALPALQDRLTSTWRRVDEDTLRHFVGMIDDVLNKYAGRLQEWGEQLDREAANPVVWFREGVQTLLLLPAFVLRSLGLLPASSSVTTGLLGRIVSGIVSLVVLVAALVQIVSGWDSTLAKLRQWGIWPSAHSTVAPTRWSQRPWVSSLHRSVG